MKRSLLLVFACALSSQAATISLDTAGADPDLTTPFFTFPINNLGTYNATYRNVSLLHQDFIMLTLVAPFTSPYFAGAAGSSCNGGHAFYICGVSYDSNALTVTFTFSGVDGSHPGLPYQGFLNLSATGFQPGTQVGGVATAVTSAIPEPGSLALALSGIVLTGLVIRRNKLLKLRVGL